MIFYQGCLPESPRATPRVGESYAKMLTDFDPQDAPETLLLRTGEIFDQTGEHCVATAILDAAKTLTLEDLPHLAPRDVPLGSRRWLHWQSYLSTQGGMGRAGGRIPTLAYDAIRAQGIPQESFWPYLGTDDDGPPLDSRQHAFDQRFQMEARSVTESYLLHAALVLRRPGAVVMVVDQALLDYYGGDWTGGGSFKGLHMMMVVGYTPEHFVCKNSWGMTWGVNGYIYIPRRVLDDSDVVQSVVVFDQGVHFSEVA